MISLELRTRCAKCNGDRFVDVTHWAKGVPTSGVACHVCQEPLEFTWLKGSTAALAALTITPMPHEARRYLDEHPDFPSGEVPFDPASALTRTPSSPALFGPGSRLGKYEIVRRIGMGGMAEILLGRQLGLEGFEKKVVIKRILPHLAVQPRFVSMFTQEARVAARLANAHIVQIYDLCREQDEFFIVMEYVRGPDLNTLVKLAIRSGALLPIELCCRIVADVASALHAAHSYVDDNGRALPVLHRDVTPHNILVGRDGVAKLTDFGVSKATDSIQDTGTGILKGKVMYMAPEHVRSGISDPRIDVFSLGLVFYLCLTLRHPFRASSEIETLKAVLDAPIAPLASLRPEIPAQLAEIVHKAIERDPAQRYQSARELQSALESFLAKAGIATPAHIAAWLDTFLANAAQLGGPVIGEIARAEGRPAPDNTKTTPEKVGRLRVVGGDDDDHTIALRGWEDDG